VSDAAYSGEPVAQRRLGPLAGAGRLRGRPVLPNSWSQNALVTPKQHGWQARWWRACQRLRRFSQALSLRQ